MPPYPTGNTMPVSTSVIAWPSAPNSLVSGSKKVSVPMPAVLSRTQAPRRYAPSRASRTGSTSNTSTSSPRTTSISASPPSPIIDWSCAALVTSVSLTRTIRSPALIPAMRAGLGVFPMSDEPTTTTPSVSIATPTDWPPGISTFSASTVTATVLTGISPRKR